MTAERVSSQSCFEDATQSSAVAPDKRAQHAPIRDP